MKNSVTGRHFFRLFLPALFILLAITFAGIRWDAQEKIARLKITETTNIEIAASTIAQDFQSVTSDLRVQANDPDLLRYLDSGTVAARLAEEQRFVVLSREKGLYEQIRYLDADGMEVIRINHNNGLPSIVSQGELQNKAGRYFFKDALKLQRGEVFVSPLDLNIEHGKIEIPLKPMIRFGTPVFDSGGRKKGIVLFNYYGAKLLDHFKDITAQGNHRAMLLNSDGYWLSSPQAEDEWGFMLNNQRSFANTYREEWKTISSARQGSVLTANGLFSFASIFPLRPQQRSATGTAAVVGSSARELQGNEYYWKIVSFTPSKRLPNASLAQYPIVRMIFIATLLLIALGSWYIARSWTARQFSREILAESEARFRLMADSVPVLIWVAGTDQLCTYFNKGWLDFTGRSAEQEHGNGWTEGIHPDDFSRCLGTYAKAFEARLPFSTEYRLRRHDGEFRWVFDHGVPRISPAGELLGYIGSCIDITERKQVEEELRERKDFLAAILASEPECVKVLAPNGDLVQMNRAGLAMLEVGSFNDAKKRGLLNFILPEYRDAFNALIQRVFSGDTATLEFQIEGAKGTRRWLDTHATPVRDAAGKIVSLVAVTRDVTEQKQAEEALRLLNETLENRVADEVAKNMEQERMLIQQSRLAAMGEMIGNIAHQWRQPLNALGLLLANIKDAHRYQELDTEMLEGFVVKGRRYIEKMSSTIDDFRNFFKPNKLKTVFQLDQPITEVLNLLSPSLKEHNISVHSESNSNARINGFPNEFSQVLLNLLNNSKDAIMDAQVTDGKIAISLGEDDIKTWVTIQDNGGGVPAEILPKIFDPYFTTKEKGTGIGLFMSKMIMEHMDGSIACRNVGDGTEFKLTLPKAS